MSDEERRIGCGTKFYIGRGTPYVYTEITGLIGELSLPSSKADKIDMSDFSSRIKKSGNGMVEMGDVEINTHFIPNSVEDKLFLELRNGNDEIVSLKWVLQGTVTEPVFSCVYLGSCSGYDRNIPMDDKRVSKTTFSIYKAVSDGAGTTPTGGA